MNLHYFDADAGELRRFIEGSNIRLVRSLRTMIGVALAFDGDGWVVGYISDLGEFTVHPYRPGEQKRHISDYGRKVPLRFGKPEMLDARPDPPELAATRIALFRGANTWLCAAETRLLEFVGGTKLLVFDRRKDFDFDQALLDVFRRRIAERMEFILDLSGKLWDVPGPVYVRHFDLPALILTFGRFVE